jgi:hypothetical protein
MSRIVASVFIGNPFDADKQIRVDALVDTGTAGLVLPTAWRDRLGALPLLQAVDLETADQRTVTGEVCGPVVIRVDGFRAISNEVTFTEMQGRNGAYEPLLGYIILEQSQAAVDMVAHRLVPVKYVDLKVAVGDRQRAALPAP